MSDDFRRRRRMPSGTTRSTRRSGGDNNGMNPWVITIFAALVVIAGGWFLGQALARVFNGPPKTQVAVASPLPTGLPVVTPPPSPAVTPLDQQPSAPPTPRKPKPAAQAAPPPTPKPKRTRAAAPTPSPAPAQTATSAPAAPPSAVPAVATPRAHVTAAPTVRPTSSPVRHTAPPAPPSLESGPSSVVRAYIDALRRGDPTAASSYLGNGSPDESFIDAATHITSITSARNADGSYKVSVDMRTAKGEYYETFTVASNRILDKTAIKP